MPDTLGRLPREVELAIFRVLQECLINVHQHSENSAVRVRLFVQNGSAYIEVRDNGKGMPVAILQAAGEGLATTGVGLRGIIGRLRQLGGKLEITSSEEGSTVLATLPYEDSRAAKDYSLMNPA